MAQQLRVLTDLAEHPVGFPVLTGASQPPTIPIPRDPALFSSVNTCMYVRLETRQAYTQKHKWR